MMMVMSSCKVYKHCLITCILHYLNNAMARIVRRPDMLQFYSHVLCVFTLVL